MATSTIREFLVAVGFKVDEAGLGKFNAAVAGATVTAVVLGAAVVAAAASVLAAVKSIAGEYDELDKLATRFRSTVDAVDEFNDIGGLLGLTNEQTVGSLKALDKGIADTALGVGRAKIIFENLGLQVLDSAGKMRPTLDVMDDLAVKLKDMERGKALAVMERLGLDPALLKVFNSDLAGLRAELADIDKAAGFDLGDAVASSKDFIKSWKALQLEVNKTQLVFGKMYEAIGVKLMPQLGRAVDEMRVRIEAARRYIMENLGQLQEFISGTIGVLLRVFQFGWALFGRLSDAIAAYVRIVIGAFRSLDPTVQLIIAGVLGLTAAWKLLNLAFLASPVTWVLALGAALLALYDDYQTFKEGGESLIDWAQWQSEADIVAAIFENLHDVLYTFFTALFTVVGGLVTGMGALWEAAKSLAAFLSGAFVTAWAAVGAAVDAVVGTFKTAFEWIAKVVDGAGKLAGFGGSLSGSIATAGASFAQAQPLGATGPYGGSLSVNQQTVIQVQGGDAAATGRAVAGEQNRVNADMTRNARGAAR